MRELWAFANGYADRKMFTADTTAGSVLLRNVSDTAGLAASQIVSGPSIPPDSVISGAGGPSEIVMNQKATATATQVEFQRAGSPGIRFRLAAGMVVHFDSCAGDQNGGGLLRLVGPGDAGGYGSGIVVTNMKAEFGENVYINGYAGPGGTGGRPVDVPQQPNAIVLDNLTTSSVSIRGLVNWGTKTSGVNSYVPPNGFGRDIGAAILNIGTAAAPTVSWESLRVGTPAGSTQVRVAYRDSLSPTAPILVDASGRGTNRPVPSSLAVVGDVDATASVQDSVLSWSSTTAARKVTLPALASVPVGRMFVLVGASNTSATNTITATPSGTDTIVGASRVESPFGQLTLISNGTQWVGSAPGDVTQTGTQTLVNKTLTSPRTNGLVGLNGTAVLETLGLANAVNSLRISNGATGIPPQLTLLGTDPNVSLQIIPKGTGAVQIVAGSGVTPRIGIVSPDVDANLNLTAKGNGVVMVNSNPAGAKTPIPGNLVWGGKPGEFAADATGMYVYVGDGTTHTWSGVVTGATQGTNGKPLSLWTGTKSQYDSIPVKSQTCIYVVSSVAVTTGDIMVDEGAETGDIAAEPVAEEPVTRSATTKSTRKK
jgi:hypothetical protein